MGSTQRAEAPIASWTARFESRVDSKGIAHWKSVFTEHPEFFLVYEHKKEEKAALRWRYARKLFDSRENKKYTEHEADALDPDKRDLLTSEVLDQAQLQTLISTAIEMQKKAAAEREEARWLLKLLVTTAVGFATTAGGVVLGYFLHVDS